jgi:enamine deaminase RidA (YjgF/YER057c/UK114 family)
MIMGGKPMPWGKGVVAGGFVFLSCLEGRLTDDGVLVPGIAEQTTLALSRDQQYLTEAGSSFERVVRITQYLARPADHSQFHAARDRWMAQHAPQLLANQSYGGVLVVQQFTAADQLIELEVTALA